MARILLIDDDANLLQMVRLMLERVGHEVTTSNNGEEGILMAAKSQPELAIIDVMMPGLSGYDVVRKLRADPATAGIPIIILTARSQPMDKHMALEAGANAFLSKPVTAQELTDRVEAVLRAGVHYRVHTGLLTEPIAKEREQTEATAPETAAPDAPPAPAPDADGDDLPPARPHPTRTTPIPAPPASKPGTGRVPIGAEDAPPVPARPSSAPPVPSRPSSERRRMPIGAEDVATPQPARPQPAEAEQPAPAPAGRLPVVTVVSLRGGTGCTTIAVNLAALLAGHKRRVCLTDLSTSSGQVPLHLRLQTTRSWGELLGQGETPDVQALKPLLLRHPQSGIVLLPAPVKPVAQGLSTAATQHALRELSTGFQHVIVDAGGLDAAATGALRSSLVVIVVMTDDPPAINATLQLLDVLNGLGLETGRVRVVLNHVRPMPDIAAESIQKMLKRPLTVELPYDSGQVSAMRRGVPLVIANPEGAFAVKFQQLARALAM